MLTLSDKPRPSHPALAWRQVQDEVVLVDPTQEETVVRIFNPVAGAIWRRLDGETPLAAIAADLAAIYDAPRQEIEQDVLAFVQTLRAKALVAF